MHAPIVKALAASRKPVAAIDEERCAAHVIRASTKD